MRTDYKLTPELSKTKITIKLTYLQNIKLQKRLKELDMNESQYFLYLIEEYEGDNLTSLRNFRYNLKRRVKKGINLIYINELLKLRDFLNILLEKL